MSEQPAGELIHKASQANPRLIQNPAGHLDENMANVIPPQAVDVRAERIDMGFIMSQQERLRVNLLQDEVFNDREDHENNNNY